MVSLATRRSMYGLAPVVHGEARLHQRQRSQRRQEWRGSLSGWCTRGCRCEAVGNQEAEILIPSSSLQASSISDAEVVVVGSGVGGLSCAALLAKYGVKVVVLESHYQVGGAAHGWSAKTKSGVYHFESGPSLYSGMQSRSVDGNPLGHVLQAVGAELEWVMYDSWKIYFPEGEWNAKVGQGEFLKVLSDVKGSDSPAIEEWKRLEEYMKIYAPAASSIPPIAIRNDLGALLTTVGRFFPSFLKYGTKFPQLLVPFSKFIEGRVTDKFILDYLDLLCFLLSGLPAYGTITAEMAVMFNEWYKPNCCLEFPKGGSQAMVDALVKQHPPLISLRLTLFGRSIERNGGAVFTRSHVEEILIEDNRAVGVRLKNGRLVKASKAVVSNASLWDTVKIIDPDKLPSEFRQRNEEMPTNPSFMHLHLGFDATDLDVDLHHIVVNSWEPSVDSEQNVVLISIPSVVDPSFAPSGKHALHAYLPATEPYNIWADLKRNSPEYEALKTERAEVLWKGIERAIPDIRDRTEIAFIGTPLTHERFLRRHRGTYGPAIICGEDTFPSQSTSIKGLLCCGDSTFPGIGLPAVAASGAITANSLVSIGSHLKLLTEMEF